MGTLHPRVHYCLQAIQTICALNRMRCVVDGHTQLLLDLDNQIAQLSFRPNQITYDKYLICRSIRETRDYSLHEQAILLCKFLLLKKKHSAICPIPASPRFTIVFAPAKVVCIPPDLPLLVDDVLGKVYSPLFIC